MSAGTANDTEAAKMLAELLGEARAAIVAGVERPALLWSEGADRLLWSSPAAPALFGMAEGLPSFSSAVPGVARLRSFAKGAKPGDRLHEALRFFVGGRLEGLKTQTLALQLADGSPALLSVFGAGPGIELPAAPPPPPPPTSRPAEPADAAPAMAGAAATARPVSRPARFLFLTDDEGRLQSLSAAFGHLTGTDPADLIGQPLADVVADIDPLRGAEMARAMFSRAAWSGLAVDWPGENGEETPIEFSATPVFDSARAFIGYNGFGMVRAPRPPQAPVQHGAEPAAAVPAAETSIKTPDAAGKAAGDLNAREDLLAREDLFARDEDARDAEERLAELLARDSEPTEVALDEGEVTETAAPAPRASSPDRKPAAPKATIEPQAPAVVAPPEVSPVVVRQDNETAVPTIVPLRNANGNVGASAGEKKVVPLKPVRSQEQGLTHSERNAFREIARALGARIDGEPGVLAAGQEPAPREPAATVTPLAEPTRTVAPRDATENRVAAAQAEISKALQAAYEQTPATTAEPAKRVTADVALSDILVERVPVGVLVFRGDKPIYMNRPLLDLLGYSDINEFIAHDGLEKLFRGRAAPSFSNGEYDTITIMGRNGQTLPADAHPEAAA